MSDDIPIIFAQQEMSPPPVGIFLSASHPAQMEQFVLANWRVMLAPDFSGCEIPADLIVESFNPDTLEGPPALLSANINSIPDDWHHRVRLFSPSMVKINAALTDDAELIVDAASVLGDLNYTLCAAYWRNDNAFALKTLDRIDALSVFQPTPWTNLNLLAFSDAGQAKDMLRFGRFFAGQEKRVGELQVTNVVRGDYIQQLEDALIKQQSDGPITLK